MNADERRYGNEERGTGALESVAKESAIKSESEQSEEALTENLESELTGKIIGTFYDVYNELCHGFLESVYVNALYLSLVAMGLHVEKERRVPVWFRGQLVGDFKADLVVEGRVIIEVKAVRAFDPAHEAQLLNYLRGTDIQVGLLVNFGPNLRFRRMAYSNSRKLRCNSVAKS